MERIHHAWFQCMEANKCLKLCTGWCHAVKHSMTGTSLSEAPGAGAMRYSVDSATPIPFEQDARHKTNQVASDMGNWFGSVLIRGKRIEKEKEKVWESLILEDEQQQTIRSRSGEDFSLFPQRSNFKLIFQCHSVRTFFLWWHGHLCMFLPPFETRQMLADIMASIEGWANHGFGMPVGNPQGGDQVSGSGTASTNALSAMKAHERNDTKWITSKLKALSIVQAPTSRVPGGASAMRPITASSFKLVLPFHVEICKTSWTLSWQSKNH